MSCFDIQQNDGWENLPHCCINRRNYELSHYLSKNSFASSEEGEGLWKEAGRVRFIKGLLEEDVVFLREGNKVLTRIPCGHSSFLATLHSNLPLSLQPHALRECPTLLQHCPTKQKKNIWFKEVFTYCFIIFGKSYFNAPPGATAL